VTHFLPGLCLLFLLPCLAAASGVVVYPIPDQVPVRQTFTVRVRAPGGPWQAVPCYQAEVDLHRPRLSSMATFDFDDKAEVEVTFHGGVLKSARVRPNALGISPEPIGNTFTFELAKPQNLSIEVNGDLFDNLQLFANPIERNAPRPTAPNVIYFGPGVHSLGSDVIVPSNTTVYLAGGAVLMNRLVCDHVSNVRIAGRGIVWRAAQGIELSSSNNVTIEGITVLNPDHYSIAAGQSRNITIRNFKSISSGRWSDGIDMMSCSDVLIDGIFMRNSDDCIAIYGHRGSYYGDARNITVRNATLWADVAHPIFVGTHGDPQKPDVIEDLAFRDIDVLDQNEPQVGYQGCFAINASDENLVRNVLVEDLRVEDFAQGQLVNLRVTFNRTYAKAPGRGIENVMFRNMTYTGHNANLSILSGYDDGRVLRNVVFENLVINGAVIWDGMPGKLKHFATADMARFYVGDHVEGLEFRRSEADTKAVAARPPATAGLSSAGEEAIGKR